MAQSMNAVGSTTSRRFIEQPPRTPGQEDERNRCHQALREVVGIVEEPQSAQPWQAGARCSRVGVGGPRSRHPRRRPASLVSPCSPRCCCVPSRQPCRELAQARGGRGITLRRGCVVSLVQHELGPPGTQVVRPQAEADRHQKPRDGGAPQSRQPAELRPVKHRQQEHPGVRAQRYQHIGRAPKPAEHGEYGEARPQHEQHDARDLR